MIEMSLGMTVALQYIEMKGPVNILQITEAIDCFCFGLHKATIYRPPGLALALKHTLIRR